MSDIYIWCFITYVAGTAVGVFMGRQWGIKIGSHLTFDLLVRLGYVNYSTNEQGEVKLRKVQQSGSASDEL